VRVNFYGLSFETPCVSFHLWSPWRAAELEHRLFTAVRTHTRAEPEPGPDEVRLAVTEPKALKAALHAVSRVLKGWQEEADPGGERRSWRWLLEGDTDADGFDHNGDPVALWALVRVSLERGGPGEEGAEKSETIDLEGFSLCIWGEHGQR
jgi:hypothetical protein